MVSLFAIRHLRLPHRNLEVYWDTLNISWNANNGSMHNSMSKWGSLHDMILGQKQKTLFLNDHSFLYEKWGEYCITSPLRYNCSFSETLCLYCGIFSFCVKQIKLKQSSRSPARKIYWFVEDFLKNKGLFLEILVPACWTVVLSHSLTHSLSSIILIQKSWYRAEASLSDEKIFLWSSWT